MNSFPMPILYINPICTCSILVLVYLPFSGGSISWLFHANYKSISSILFVDLALSFDPFDLPNLLHNHVLEIDCLTQCWPQIFMSLIWTVCFNIDFKYWPTLILLMHWLICLLVNISIDLYCVVRSLFLCKLTLWRQENYCRLEFLWAFMGEHYQTQLP